MSGHGEDSDAALLDIGGLHRLVEVLIERGYRVVGPTLRDNAIVLAELESADDLPRGWGVDVGPGHYRVRRRNDEAAFGHSAGPQSWKQFLHPPRQRLWAGTRDGTSAASEEDAPRRWHWIDPQVADAVPQVVDMAVAEINRNWGPARRLRHPTSR